MSLYDMFRPGISSRSRSLMKMLRRVENEIFAFKIDSDIALVDCTSGTLGPTVELIKEKEIFRG